MPYNQGTKYSVGRTKLTNYSVPDPNPSSEGGNINVPRVLFYNNGVRSVPIMHRAFRNLEIKYANALVADAMDYRGVSAGDLRVLDIGYGLGYSVQRFFELGVGTLHCVEINGEITLVDWLVLTMKFLIVVLKIILMVMKLVIEIQDMI